MAPALGLRPCALTPWSGQSPLPARPGALGGLPLNVLTELSWVSQSLHTCACTHVPFSRTVLAAVGLVTLSSCLGQCDRQTGVVAKLVAMATLIRPLDSKSLIYMFSQNY